MLEIIKSFFSPVGGGRTSFASQNGNQSRKQFPYENYNGKEDLRQGRNLVSNSDFNKNGGELYLNQDAITFASENIVGGGQLRSTSNGCELVSRPKVNASSRSYKGKRAYAHFKGGEGNYASLMSSDFAGTETMLNSDTGSVSFWDVDFSSRPLSGGGRKQYSHLSKGGKPFNRTLRSNIRRLVPQEFGRELYANVLASLWTRNDFSFKKGGAGSLGDADLSVSLTVCTPFHYEGGVLL